MSAVVILKNSLFCSMLNNVSLIYAKIWSFAFDSVIGLT